MICCRMGKSRFSEQLTVSLLLFFFLFQIHTNIEQEHRHRTIAQQLRICCVYAITHIVGCNTNTHKTHKLTHKCTQTHTNTHKCSHITSFSHISQIHTYSYILNFGSFCLNCSTLVCRFKPSAETGILIKFQVSLL